METGEMVPRDQDRHRERDTCLRSPCCELLRLCYFSIFEFKFPSFLHWHMEEERKRERKRGRERESPKFIRGHISQLI